MTHRIIVSQLDKTFNNIWTPLPTVPEVGETIEIVNDKNTLIGQAKVTSNNPSRHTYCAELVEGAV